ncbi:TPA: ATP-binding protein, partial [Candidatus Woesearchaeota archaeon]|nr:ATP-binding protein [Candidatus Woesearchaeota archaeon]
MITAVQSDIRSEQRVKDALENRLKSTESWGVFDMKGTPINELAASGQVTILDVSCYATMPGGWKIKYLIVGLVSQKLFLQRMTARKKEEYDQVHSTMDYFSTEDVAKKKQQMPLVWLVIDEAHEFLPKAEKDANAATEPLVTIMREGRQPGISLILATQQPGKIHTDVMTQSDIVLSHRITARMDVEALGMLTQSYMREGLTQAVDNLPRVKGAGVIFDDANEKLYPMRIRPRFTWHGGESPSAVKVEKKGFE